MGVLEHPRRLDVPMVERKHSKFILGSDRNLVLLNLQMLEYEIEMQCRLSKEEDFAKHLEIISSVQRSKPMLHTLELRGISSAAYNNGYFY